MRSRLLAVLLIVLMLAGALAAKQEPVTDDAIYNQVRIRLASDQVVKGGGLDVEVKQGVVTLKGAVEGPKQRERAEKLAKKVKGVKQVVNNITIRK